MNENIFGCFISYPSFYEEEITIEMRKRATADGDLFKTYIWGDKGISDKLKNLNYKSYGEDIKLALFQFYLKPIPYLLNHLKDIESYRKKEKAIGISIIVNDDNFFCKSEEERYDFLKQSILAKLDLLSEVVKKKKLDTNMELLKSDLQEIFSSYP